MLATPYDWNVVTAGAWNLAILTPQGIARRLFGLEPGTPVEVQVALDGTQPMRVMHADMMVQPSKGRLLVQPAEANLDALLSAAAIAVRAVKGLPETPVAACGVNFRFAFDALPDVLINANRSTLDDKFAEADLRIASRTLKRALNWKAGLLNFELEEDDEAAGKLVLNFHLASNKATEHCEWLENVRAMHERALAVLDKLGISLSKEKHE